MSKIIRNISVAVVLICFTGCKTTDIGSKLGLTASESATKAASLTPGVRPVERDVTSSPFDPPDTISPPDSSPEALTELINSGRLAGEYNGVLVSFLGHETRQWMEESDRKTALDQAVTALKEKIRISPDKQVETGLGTAVGIAMQMGGDVSGKAGASVAGDYYSEMNDWIEAAFDLAALGYKDEAGTFFEYGMKYFPYDEHRGRCVEGYAMVHPQEAYTFLTGKLKGPATEEIQAAIRMMGHLASSEGLDEQTKAKCMETISGYAEGMMNSLYFLDAIYALDVSNDPRAVPALKRFMKGMMVTDEQQRPALTSLALRYKDPEAIEVLESIVNAGAFSNYDWRDKQFAFAILVRAGEDGGYDYAKANLAKRAKGFMAASDQPDLKPEIIDVMVRYGDLRGANAMLSSFDKYDDDEWLKTWMATGMMLLGEGCAMELAKSNINKPGWEFTAVSIAQGLAMYGDNSGIDVLSRLISLRQVSDGQGAQFLQALAGKNDAKAKKERLEQLRVKIARTLGMIDNAACIPPLERLLNDESDNVRRAAANALVEMSVPEAIPAITKALDVNYGVIAGQQLDTTPLTHARLVRAAGNRWGDDERIKPVLDKGAESPYASVQLLAVAMKR